MRLPSIGVLAAVAAFGLALGHRPVSAAASEPGGAAPVAPPHRLLVFTLGGPHHSVVIRQGGELSVAELSSLS